MCGGSDADQAEPRLFDEAGVGEAKLMAAQPRFTPERKAAIERALARLEKGLPLGMTRPFTRDEMQER